MGILPLYASIRRLMMSPRLLVASEYDAFQIVKSLSPYLAGSASIVVQSPFLQVGTFGFLSMTAVRHRATQCFL